MGPPSRWVRAVAASAAGAALAGAYRLATVRGRVTVDGASMEPALSRGDRVVLFPPWRLRPGDVVAVPDPRAPDRLVIKRVTSIDRRHQLVSIEGDNLAQSTDSRVFGPVAQGTIVGRAVYRYAPAGRMGPVGRSR